MGIIDVRGIPGVTDLGADALDLTDRQLEALMVVPKLRKYFLEDGSGDPIDDIHPDLEEVRVFAYESLTISNEDGELYASDPDGYRFNYVWAEANGTWVECEVHNYDEDDEDDE